MGNMWRKIIDEYIEPLTGLFFPPLCPGCSSELIASHQILCLSCHQSLPGTGFEKIKDNPVEKLFWGRTVIAFAGSSYYYVENTPMQRIIHEVKYKEDKKSGIALGRMMGMRIREKLNAFPIDMMIPMPLHPKKEKQRGYNQASLLCRGMKEIIGTDFEEKIIARTKNTATQTQKSRLKRWENVASVFRVDQPDLIRDKNLLLVDDVITTGASTEACAAALLQAGARSVAVYSLAFTLS